MLTNPGYEFEMALEVVSRNKIIGKRTRRFDQMQWPVDLRYYHQRDIVDWL
jgi:hypothetical protein